MSNTNDDLQFIDVFLEDSTKTVLQEIICILMIDIGLFRTSTK